MKTLKGWHESEARCLEDYLQVGDEVDVDMVNYFRDILPPRSDLSNYLQVGEPYSVAMANDRKCYSTWTTFKCEDGKWYYKGHCFVGETVDGEDWWWVKNG